MLVLAAVALAGCSSDDETAATTPGTTATAETVPTGPARLRLEPVLREAGALVHVTVAPGEPERLYLVDRDGLILVLEDGQLGDERFLDVRDLVTSGGEQGLLSVAFHPDYEENRLFYVNYTDLQGDTRVVEYERVVDPPIRRREILFVDQPYANHNGGQLAFGPDGLLYVGMGDGGSGGDPENRAQDLSSRLGKLLRLDVNRDGATWETVAYGLRNPWRFSFDRETGDLWIGDVGQGEIEEIDYLPRDTQGLVNFGWDVFEGSRPFEDKEPDPSGELLGPVAEYDHGEGCSVTGGFVYRGEAIPAAQGRYFYGDYCSGNIWSLVLRDARAADVRKHDFTVEGLSSFGEDAAGELYLVTLGGELFRLEEG
ncbi:MAG: PQQ-dependent sugar dehydrogenase [Gaiellales bacterium]